MAKKYGMLRPPVGPITQILAGARIHGACCEEEKSRPPSQVNRIEEERGCARIKHRDFSLAVKIIVQFVTREERGEGFVLRAILLCIKHQSRLNSRFIKFWNVFFKILFVYPKREEKSCNFYHQLWGYSSILNEMSLNNIITMSLCSLEDYLIIIPEE